MDKVDSMQEQMGNISREMETLRKNQKKYQRLKKNTVTEMQNAFDGFISRLGIAKEGISELEYISVEISKTEK